MGVFTFAERSVAFVDEGSAANPQTLLLIPGLGGTMGFWRHVREAFAQDYRVLSFDHPGMGDSSEPAAPTSVQMLAELSVGLLDHLHIQRAVFVGHSMGGIIAQTVAGTYPERVSALVLSSTWLRADHYFRKAFAQRLWILQAGGAEAYARAQTLSVFPPEFIANSPHMVDAQEQRSAAAFRNPAVVRQRIDALLAFDGTSQLAKIHHGALVVYCDDDSVVPAYMSRQLAGELRVSTERRPVGSAASGVQELQLSGGGHFAPLVIAKKYITGLEQYLCTL